MPSNIQYYRYIINERIKWIFIAHSQGVMGSRRWRRRRGRRKKAHSGGLDRENPPWKRRGGTALRFPDETGQGMSERVSDTSKHGDMIARMRPERIAHMPRTHRDHLPIAIYLWRFPWMFASMQSWYIVEGQIEPLNSNYSNTKLVRAESRAITSKRWKPKIFFDHSKSHYEIFLFLYLD